jgi:hypothetical protein
MGGGLSQRQGFLVFIGVPLFIVGLANAQAKQS